MQDCGHITHENQVLFISSNCNGNHNLLFYVQRVNCLKNDYGKKNIRESKVALLIDGS